MIRVYTGPCCTGSDRARNLVEWVRTSHPDANIEVVEVDDLTEVPESLFALPTWYRDADVWKLGNPSPSELIQAIKEDGDERDNLNCTGRQNARRYS